MRFGKLVPAALLLGITLLPTVARADFFTSLSSFNAANPGLPVLTFEGIAPSKSYIEPAPSFAGVTFTDATSGSSSFVDISSSSFFNTPTDVLFLNQFTEPLTMTFSPTANAVGFNVASGFGGGTATLTVYNGLILLETETVTTASENSFTTFTGFSNLGTITSLTITPQADHFVLIDNLAFGSTRSTPSTPEPGSLAMLIGMGVSGAGLLIRRRRQSGKTV